MLGRGTIAGHAQAAGPSTATALTAPPGAMAEATIATDPARPNHLAAAADPYLGPVRIVVTTSNDGGATWSGPVTVLPSGFAKSYDPALAFDSVGNVLVVGGASGQGAPHCQPDSAVFMATVKPSGVAYLVVRDAREDGAYVDRPEVAVSGTGPTTSFVTWTESTGPQAECAAMPARSTIMLARLDGVASVRDVRPVPSSGLMAPFGATLAVAANGSLAIVVGEHGGGRARLVAVNSPDGGSTLTAPVVVDEGPDVPLTLAGVGGVIAPVPSVAVARDGRVSAAWNKQTASGPEVAVFQAPASGTWVALGSPTAGAAALLPTVAYDTAGRLQLLVARPANGSVDYQLFNRSPDWDAGTRLGGGPSSQFSEIGESLGLVPTVDAVVACFPVDGPTGSSLTVARLATPPPPPPPTPPPTTAGSAPPQPGRAPRGGGRGRTVVVGGLVLLVTTALAYGLARRRPGLNRRGTGSPRR